MWKKIIFALIASLLSTLVIMVVYKKKHTPPPALPEVDVAQSENLPEFQKALEEILLTDPKLVKEFPSELQFYLAREGCKIPHPKGDPNKLGWIKGHFFKASQTDYAVICMSPTKEMTIKIFWGDERPCPISIGYGMSKKYVVPSGDHGFAYARSLMKAGAERLRYYAYHARLPTPNAGQEALEDVLLGTKTTIWYCQNNEWHALPTR